MSAKVAGEVREGCTMLNVNMATARNYVENYITNSGMDVSDYCIDQAASDLVDYVDTYGVDGYDGVPSDEFTDIVTQSAC